jgi:hypothetical protein
MQMCQFGHTEVVGAPPVVVMKRMDRERAQSGEVDTAESPCQSFVRNEGEMLEARADKFEKFREGIVKSRFGEKAIVRSTAIADEQRANASAFYRYVPKAQDDCVACLEPAITTMLNA